MSSLSPSTTRIWTKPANSTLNDTGLITYSHGEYFLLGKKLGTFGYSVRKDTPGKRSNSLKGDDRKRRAGKISLFPKTIPCKGETPRTKRNPATKT